MKVAISGNDVAAFSGRQHDEVYIAFTFLAKLFCVDRSHIRFRAGLKLIRWADSDR
jgi:hypothetical protein